MIEKLEINAVHAEVNDDLRKYVTKKIGKMDLYMSRHTRASAHIEVKLKEANTKGKNQSTCEVILYLPQEALTVKETTVNMYAAVDIVEAKLKNLLKKYKEKHNSPKLRRRIMSRLRRKS